MTDEPMNIAEATYEERRAAVRAALVDVNRASWRKTDLEQVVDNIMEGAGLLRPKPAVLNIQSRDELVAFAMKHGLRKDWHEPDEQNISARVEGDHLDNAMGSGLEHNHGELQVVLTKRVYPTGSDTGVWQDIAVVNLATLLSWATDGGY